MSKYYFTYAQEGHPFCGGWTEVEAPNGHAACAAFRAYHPDKQDGFINCAAIYSEADFQATKMPYGRPLKSKTRRTKITISAPGATIEAIDAFVAEYAQATGTAYSRSDFYNEAAIAKLKENGIVVDDEPEQRTFSVPKNSAAGCKEPAADGIDARETTK